MAAILRMQCLHGSEGKRENGYVIFLAEGLSGAGDGVSGLVADGAGTVEAEELPALILRFNDAIGDEQQRFAFEEPKFHGAIGGSWRSAQWQRAFHREFLSVEIGRQMAGVRQFDPS